LSDRFWKLWDMRNSAALKTLRGSSHQILSFNIYTLLARLVQLFQTLLEVTRSNLLQRNLQMPLQQYAVSLKWLFSKSFNPKKEITIAGRGLGEYGGPGSTGMEHRQWQMCHTGWAFLTADISGSFKQIASRAIIWTSPSWRKRRLHSIKKVFHLARCRRGKVDSYQWGVRFESRLGHYLSWLFS
jgi:hypothetical protein